MRGVFIGGVSMHVGIQIVALIGIIAGLYFPFIHNPFVFDDLGYFIPGEKGDIPIIVGHFGLFDLRSFPFASFAWTIEWFGFDVRYLRIGNLALHAATSITLMFFVSKVLRLTGAIGSGVTWLPFVAAVFFAIHPVAVYATGYLVQRSIVMATLFALLSLLAYCKAHEGNNRWLVASIFFYLLAVMSKEHAIMLPAAVAALVVLLNADWKSALWRKRLYFFCLASIAVAVVLAKRQVIGASYEPNAVPMLAQAEAPYIQSMLTQCTLFFKYLGLWIMPNPQWLSVDMRESLAPAVFSPYLGGFLLFLGWGISGIWLLLKKGRYGVIGFAMLFPWLLFMTEFSTVRIQEIFVLYRSYLWMPGLFLLIPLLLVSLDKFLLSITVAAVCTAAMVISVERLSTFSHLVLLWEDAAKLVRNEDAVGAYRVHYNLGTNLLDIGDDRRALDELKRASALLPTYAGAHGNQGVAYFKLQKWENALAEYAEAIRLSEQSPDIYSPAHRSRFHMGIAMTYEKLGRTKLAQQHYSESCSLNKMGCEKLAK